MTITSPHNEQLKQIRRLSRQRRSRERAGRFVAEGEDLLAAADAAGWTPVTRLCAAGSGLTGVEVEPALLGAASGLGSGSRAVAIYEERWAPSAAGPVCVYLHGVHDPGNVGTILRCAEAFGAACVAIGPDTADPFGPRAVRASMGAVFTVAVARVHDPARLPAPTVALDADGGVALAQLSLSAGTLMIGSERDGLPAELIASADQRARIPVANHSLNAAMAAAVALYEISRMTSP